LTLYAADGYDASSAMNDEDDRGQPFGYRRLLGLVGGLVAALIFLFVDLDPANPLVSRTAAVAALMAIWWITEAIPIPATALLPVALFPLLGVMPGREVAGTYFNNIIFLFIGGFIMALAMQRWELHRRIALRVILLIGGGPKKIILGFMLATAFLSMWISNTATTMMMVPIALAVTLKFDESSDRSTGKFATGLLIAVAYAASVGGLATLIGTPPNAAFVQIFAISFPGAPEIGFARWFVFGLPCSLVMLSFTWLVVTTMFVPRGLSKIGERAAFRQEYRRLGRMSYEEKLVLILFTLMALAWLSRNDLTIGAFTLPGWSSLMPVPSFIDDGTIAIAVSLLLFVIPSRSRPGERLIDWATASRLHWGIVLLFGGGFALAGGFKESGLSQWLAGQLTGLESVPPVVMVGSICGMLTFLTELTSNTATTQMILPLLASLALAIHVNPLLLMIPATLSASCAFMLPVATPPNAIVFGSGRVRMVDMVRVGLIMNLIGIVLLTTLIYVLGLFVFSIDLSTMPVWAGG